MTLAYVYFSLSLFRFTRLPLSVNEPVRWMILSCPLMFVALRPPLNFTSYFVCDVLRQMYLLYFQVQFLEHYRTGYSGRKGHPSEGLCSSPQSSFYSRIVSLQFS